MPKFETENTVGIILAGGQGSRMGHMDKGLVVYQNRTLIQRVTDKIAPQVDTIIISANRNIQQYQRLGYTVISDQHELPDKQRGNREAGTLGPSFQGASFQGPMAGIASCLSYLHSNTNYQYALISSCDTPDLPSSLGQRLREALDGEQVESAIAHDGHRSQNLHCLIRRNAWGNLIEHFEAGERAMYAWQQKVPHVSVDFSDYSNAFRNLNLPEDLTASNRKQP